MTATATTQEQLEGFNSITQTFVNETGLAGNLETSLLLKRIQIIHNTPGANSDDTRYKRFFINENGGTISTFTAAGVPEGTDFNSSKVPHEQTSTLLQYGGERSFAERNLGKLKDFISSIKVDPAGMVDAYNRFISEGWSKIFVDEMLAAMWTFVEDALFTELNAVATTEVYGDVVLGTTGDVIPTNNLITGGFAGNDTLKKIATAMKKAKDVHGNRLRFVKPSVYIADYSVEPEVIEAVAPKVTINSTHGSFLDYYNSMIGQPLVVAYPATGTLKVHAFTDEFPLTMLCETPAPRVRIAANTDKYGNASILIDWIFSFVW